MYAAPHLRLSCSARMMENLIMLLWWAEQDLACLAELQPEVLLGLFVMSKIANFQNN